MTSYNGPPIPYWRFALSYVLEQHIEQSASIHNPELNISLIRGKFQLFTENAIYSYEDRYHNFRLAFKKLDFKHRSFDNILVLGLGLGSVPLLLQQLGMRPKSITVVEIDDEVIRLAQDYVLYKVDLPMQVICADAQVFVETTEEKYDLIIADVFLDTHIPDYFQSSAFLYEIKRIADRPFMLMYNCLYARNIDKTRTGKYFEEIFKKEFPDAQLLEVWHNAMLYHDGFSET